MNNQLPAESLTTATINGNTYDSLLTMSQKYTELLNL